MGKPYSGDLRERVVRAVRAGHSHADVAAMFKIGERSVRRYVALWRATGSVDSLMKFGGHMKHVLSEHAAKVEKLIKARPDLTLEEMKEALAAEKIAVSTSSIDRFLKAAGLSYKKNAARQRTRSTGRERISRGLARNAKKP